MLIAGRILVERSGYPLFLIKSSFFEESFYRRFEARILQSGEGMH
jgi:hypothetical protein